LLSPGECRFPCTEGGAGGGWNPPPMTTDNDTIAFLGAGMLGTEFVKALCHRGAHVRVWNRTYAKATALESYGAIAFAEASEAVRDAQRVHLCLRDDAAVDATLDACLSAIALAAPIVDHTTVLPSGVTERAERLRSKGYAFMHAPVFMGPPNAAAGTGIMMCSGPRALYERLAPSLSAMTGHLKYLGERADLAAVYKLMGNAMILAVIGGLIPR
jgi:3-hydroxyisobutyrate dehydrogenase